MVDLSAFPFSLFPSPFSPPSSCTTDKRISADEHAKQTPPTSSLPFPPHGTPPLAPSCANRRSELDLCRAQGVEIRSGGIGCRLSRSSFSSFFASFPLFSATGEERGGSS